MSDFQNDMNRTVQAFVAQISELAVGGRAKPRKTGPARSRDGDQPIRSPGRAGGDGPRRHREGRRRGDGGDARQARTPGIGDYVLGLGRRGGFSACASRRR
jgi:hypothetical protein